MNRTNCCYPCSSNNKLKLIKKVGRKRRHKSKKCYRK